ncbi:MAG: hypothetical protein ACK559_27850, partial [bacterium]
MRLHYRVISQVPRHSFAERGQLLGGLWQRGQRQAPGIMVRVEALGPISLLFRFKRQALDVGDEQLFPLRIEQHRTGE